ncbi:MAG TPA: DoxX family protein [Thermoanaerobaculia bacterium]|nr:DoxX family protein [Thermoanaerobaculia bacterium]
MTTKQIWTGRVLSTLAVLFLLFDAIGKLVRPQAVIDGTTQLGFPVSVILPLGIIQLVCLLLYVLPRTSILGALLWTGYLGGAIATHVRLGNPLFSHVLFPLYVAALLWLGLWLRETRVRALLPLRAA